MFEKSRIIQASYTVIFPRQVDIRDRAGLFTTLLEGQYLPMLELPAVEQMPAEVPRFVYNSRHGFSQIIVSQVTCSFQVRFSPDWQTDPEKMRNYLSERLGKVYEMVKVIGDARPRFAGLSLMMNIPSSATDRDIIGVLREKFAYGGVSEALHDLELKIVRVIDETFFSNILYKNYRAFPLPGDQDAVMPMPRATAIERGIQVTGDFNDRFSYNEREHYESPMDLKERILEIAFREMQEAAEQVGGKL